MVLIEAFVRTTACQEQWEVTIAPALSGVGSLTGCGVLRRSWRTRVPPSEPSAARRGGCGIQHHFILKVLYTLPEVLVAGNS